MKPSIQTPFTPRQYMLSQDFEIYYYSDTRHNNVDLHTQFFQPIQPRVPVRLLSANRPSGTRLKSPCCSQAAKNHAL